MLPKEEGDTVRKYKAMPEQLTEGGCGRHGRNKEGDKENG